MWLRSMKIKILIALICLAVVFALIFPFIGGSDEENSDEAKNL